jgi:hypothetical protein
MTYLSLNNSKKNKKTNMDVYPIDYNKEKFLNYLEKNNVSDLIIEKFNVLPEVITDKNFEYKLNIVSTFYTTGNTHYNFELNYYSGELNEFLFTYKIFTDIEKSIDFLLLELINGKYIDK